MDFVISWKEFPRTSGIFLTLNIGFLEWLIEKTWGICVLSDDFVVKLDRQLLRLRLHNLSQESARSFNGMEAMLVLSRKKNESIVINDDITIVVVEIRGDKVRLGVEAPKHIPVHRREVYDAIIKSGFGVVESDDANPNRVDDEVESEPS